MQGVPHEFHLTRYARLNLKTSRFKARIGLAYPLFEGANIPKKQLLDLEDRPICWGSSDRLFA